MHFRQIVPVGKKEMKLIDISAYSPHREPALQTDSGRHAEKYRTFTTYHSNPSDSTQKKATFQ